MKIRGLMTVLGAALVCCCTLGCPPAEDAGTDTTPASESSVTPDSNTTE